MYEVTGAPEGARAVLHAVLTEDVEGGTVTLAWRVMVLHRWSCAMPIGGVLCSCRPRVFGIAEPAIA